MTTSCRTTDMPAVTMLNRRTSVSDTDKRLDEVQDLNLVRALMNESLTRLMPGPASGAGVYQVCTGGSLLRARLALASGHAFECSQSYRIAAAAACELIHNASLVHDDLWDGDHSRRGQPTVWKRFGQGVALCTGDLLLCAAFGVAADLSDAHQSRLLSQQLATMTSRVIVGQSIEIAPVADQPPPGLRAYLEATKAKTVPLIELPLMTGALAGEADDISRDCIRQLAGAVGLAYQVIDDLDDLSTGPQVLHPFHAWHHHRPPGQDGSGPRIQRATRHALAALDRGRRQLAHLEERLPASLAPTLQPLLAKLEQRALAHRQHIRLVREPVSYDEIVPK